MSVLSVAINPCLQVGGPYWHVPLGRKDSRTASLERANSDIPLPSQDLLTLISKFLAKGLTPTDMVALSGTYTHLQHFVSETVVRT